MLQISVFQVPETVSSQIGRRGSENFSSHPFGNSGRKGRFQKRSAQVLGMLKINSYSIVQHMTARHAQECMRSLQVRFLGFLRNDLPEGILLRNAGW
ncbi:hypothetical protein TNCV_2948501 [Trichonephila clavipes]|nr:hypothetical protein TNCV_2948501 [Trichonephila clavipes]